MAGLCIPVALVTMTAQGLGGLLALRKAAEGFTDAASDTPADERLTGLAAEVGGTRCPPTSQRTGPAPVMARAAADWRSAGGRLAGRRGGDGVLSH